MPKDSFVFYKSFYDAIKKVPEEYQLEIYNAILQYSLEGKEPESLSNIAEAMFILIKPNIDSSQRKYESSVENGKKGGRPRKTNNSKPNKNLEETQQKPNENPNKTQQKPKQNLNEDDDEDVNDNEDVNEDDDNDDDINRVFVAYENNIAPITEMSMSLLTDYCNELSPTLVIKAIEIAVEANVRTAKYIKGILENWRKKGVKNLIDVKNAEQQFRKVKEDTGQLQETEEEKNQRKIKELTEAIKNGHS